MRLDDYDATLLNRISYENTCGRVGLSFAARARVLLEPLGLGTYDCSIVYILVYISFRQSYRVNRKESSLVVRKSLQSVIVHEFQDQVSHEPRALRSSARRCSRALLLLACLRAFVQVRGLLALARANWQDVQRETHPESSAASHFLVQSVH